MSRMWDPKYYPNHEEWQPDRFLKLREEADKEHSSQFVTTTMESLGFGIGTHTCPGRFFAGNKVKNLARAYTGTLRVRESRLRARRLAVVYRDCDEPKGEAAGAQEAGLCYIGV